MQVMEIVFYFVQWISLFVNMLPVLVTLRVASWVKLLDHVCMWDVQSPVQGVSGSCGPQMMCTLTILLALLRSIRSCHDQASVILS